jgi:hypothetical protein
MKEVIKMRKFLLTLSLAILVFGNAEKGYAADRAVVGYSLSDVWYDNIFLIADKEEDNMAYKNFTVQVGDGGGHEQLYNFPNWYNAKFSPQLFYKDLNGDSLKDIIVVLTSGSGVTTSTKEVHVLNQVYDPYRRFAEARVEPIHAAVKRLVKMDRAGNEVTVLIGNQKYVVDYSKFGYHTPVGTPGFGSFENYEIKDDILSGSTNVSVTIPEASIGSIKFKYAWDGEMYKAESASFEAK